MAVLDNIVEALRHWDVWRRIEATPARVEALERRVAELEAKLQRAPGEACPSCSAYEFRVTGSKPATGRLGQVGARQHTLRCGACGYEDVRTQLPK